LVFAATVQADQLIGGLPCLKSQTWATHHLWSNLRHPPAHRDKTAMNEAQLLKARRDSSGLMSGPPALIAGDQSPAYRSRPAHFSAFGGLGFEDSPV
jgi:hypothetical protein